MTPAQSRALAVAMDGLESAGFDEATLARMRRAVEPHIEHALLRVHGLTFRDQVDHYGLCLFCGVWRGHHGHPEAHDHGEGCHLWNARHDANRRAAEIARTLPRPEPLSPAETPAGASAPQPPGGMRGG